jgi:MFS family permease
MLGVLATILIFNTADRLALGLVMQDIKVEFDLRDTQLGLMSGIAFALFYSVMGIPIARWADRGNRVTVISLTMALWSAAVALSGFVGSFVQLLLVRVGVAIGEAGCIPAAHSLISDYFPRSERPRAIGIYMLGGPLSATVGYFLAGWLNELYGWRTMFVVLGIMGLVLMPIARLTLHEPRRQSADAATSRPRLKLKEVATTLWRNVTFRYLLCSFSIVSFFANGIGQWNATYLVRNYGLATGELGGWLTIVYCTGGILGTYLGGALASRYAASNERLQLRIVALVYVIFSVLSSMTYLGVSKYSVFALLVLCTIGGCLGSAPQFALIQALVPQHMRALAVALIFLFANLIGMGLAPFAVGVLSDLLRQAAGEDSLRYALLALCPGYLWAAWLLMRASRTVTRDLHEVRAHGAAEPAPAMN